MDLKTRNNIITIVLAVLIVVLSWFLYRSLVEPYQRVIEEEQMVERERHRMELVRDVLVQYERRRGNFPPTDGGLDSLVSFLKTDSLMTARGDSMFTFMEPATYNPDSIVYSPRPPHPRFEYTLNDTIRPTLYLLENPNSEDAIGSLDRTTLRNAPNWN
ncbi:hypothetical protein [Rhodohalobacter sulfatireducens]|uniref:Type II secretion system protein GspG C-terminal domain-containing protein n=1 Tax=Rhodohalobacter sulfatireducens TaxID=2911366 RepID=A0ABS9KFR2_9BACT|nr:hypothetical protein [Rhodohalobacter sulfatireducens]MCG2589627.1 hypothetical protein [Rhodohalobacter sulfatireducens]MDR9364724.1 hypothetical protein [Balneolaceae bacterium]MDR9408541.1 hypothetical protein [Balneolaceae bacterium]